MSAKALRAIEALKRPPLSDTQKRLHLLADELPEDTTGAVVVLSGPGGVYMFGDVDSRHKAIGMLFAAATEVASNP